MIIELSPGLASWSYGDTTLQGGLRHDLDPDAELGAAVAAAVAAGVLVLIDGELDAGAVESDEESDRKRVAAQRDVVEENAALDPDEQLGGDALSERIVMAVEDTRDEWEQRMAEAAQTAVEEMS